jgi:hypothetical protein
VCILRSKTVSARSVSGRDRNNLRTRLRADADGDGTTWDPASASTLNDAIRPRCAAIARRVQRRAFAVSRTDMFQAQCRGT